MITNKDSVLKRDCSPNLDSKWAGPTYSDAEMLILVKLSSVKTVYVEPVLRTDIYAVQ